MSKQLNLCAKIVYMTDRGKNTALCMVIWLSCTVHVLKLHNTLGKPADEVFRDVLDKKSL